MQAFSLVAHPAHPPRKVRSVSVNVARNPDDGLWLAYGIRQGDALMLPASGEPKRRDGLWRTTCFELFFRPDPGEAYYEFNFSPSFEWAAYRFDRYREGMAELTEAEDPEIEISVGSDPSFFLAAEPWPNKLTAGAGVFALSAVIEETDGTKSYWALAHAPGPPDFHNPACFVATLPAPERP